LISSSKQEQPQQAGQRYQEAGIKKRDGTDERLDPIPSQKRSRKKRKNHGTG
jgi:hypothetical protein